jgi:type VI secretion system FHA domain protein
VDRSRADGRGVGVTLILTIADMDRLDNGAPTRLALERHGAVIGRSPQADWTLPDPRQYISSTHCEIDYRDGAYVLTDRSTNGVFINGAEVRMAAPHVIADGDEIMIGAYRIIARLEGAGGAGAPDVQSRVADRPTAALSGWNVQGFSPAPVDPDWDRPRSRAAISGMGALADHWAPPRVDRAAAGRVSPWALPSSTPETPASAWSSAIPDTAAHSSAAEVWGKLAAGNAVDWSRGGFGPPPPVALAPEIAPDPLGLGAAERGADAWTSEPSAEPRGRSWAAVAGRQPSDDPAAAWGNLPVTPSARAAAPGDDWSAFLAAAGLSAGEFGAEPRAVLAAAGSLLRRLVAGMVVMLEARAKAKAQLGAQGTVPGLDSNPLKFARSPEGALLQLLKAPERGFMSADRAVEDGFRDLQAHQMATLVAMQGALSATLARFSPQAIRERAETRGLLARILPAAREAELWNAYVREFEGVARGSDEAFMDVFARQFRLAYEKADFDMKSRS